MNHVAALLSMLHEPASGHSACRTFRDKPVLHWTLSRLKQAASIDTIHVACWADQADAVIATCESHDAKPMVIGQRDNRPLLQSLTAARAWADGWRGGLLGSCEFDRGFDAAVARTLAAESDADALVLIDPAAALVDPTLLDDMVEHATTNAEFDLYFSQAAPGLSGVLLRRALVDRLAIAKVTPGRMLCYSPDQYGGDPISKPACAPVPTPIARTTSRFTLDSHRQIVRLTRAMQPLNGQLISTEAEELVRRSAEDVEPDFLPRDVTLEINTDRHTRPVYSAMHVDGTNRPPMPVELAKQIFEQLSIYDDVRITLAGVGDPLLHAGLFDLLTEPGRVAPDKVRAGTARLCSVHLETDLVGISRDVIQQLAQSSIDVISVHLPAATPAVYQQVMGADRWTEAMQNLVALEAAVAARGIGTPLIVPTFTKLAVNLNEMEAWYDYWLRRLGHAVIVGATDFAGQMADPSITDMSPPARRPCHRIQQRMTVLCDGRVVSCEQDVLGKQTIGIVGQTPISTLWKDGYTSLRTCHRNGDWNAMPLCGKCREWHRP